MDLLQEVGQEVIREDPIVVPVMMVHPQIGSTLETRIVTPLSVVEEGAEEHRMRLRDREGVDRSTENELKSIRF